MVLGAFSLSLLCFRANICGIESTFSEGVGLVGCLLVKFEGPPPIFSLFGGMEGLEDGFSTAMSEGVGLEA